MDHPMQQKAAPEPQVFNQKDRIFLTTPAYGGMVGAPFTASFAAAVNGLKARFRQADGTVAIESIMADAQFLGNESHVDRGRNRCAAMFLESPYDWHLFIDADVDFTPQDIARVWQHGMNGDRVICGAYAMKGIVPQFPVTAMPGEKADERGRLKVRHSGTGFMLIHRSVYATMREKIADMDYITSPNDPEGGGQPRHAYFASGPTALPEGRIWLSEDYLFCHRWRELCGGEIIIDRNITLGHFGNIRFPVAVSEIFTAAKECRRVGLPGCPTTPI